MELQQLVTLAIEDTKASLMPFAPELILSVTIFLMLILRLFKVTARLNACWIALIGTATAFYFVFPFSNLTGEGMAPVERFTGMLIIDSFSVYIRSLLLLFAFLFAIFTRLSGIPDREDSADFYCMVLGATIGMCLMASANHLLVIFLAIEMASVPSYALAAMLKGRKQASEAALKYSIYGAGAAGVMLYGISLLAGMLNTAHLPTMAANLSVALPGMESPERMVLALAGLMIGVGLAFKLSAVPFHFWCPDVFEGASAEINAFLSVASKAGALALLVRVCIGVGVVPEQSRAPAAVAQAASHSSVFNVADKIELAAAEDETLASSGDSVTDGLGPVRTYIALLVAFIAVITSTFGNLAAYGQTNIKRLLAYSTIAHAGYMMLPIPAAMAVARSHPEIAEKAIASLALYIAFYLFMNLGAFAIVAFLRNKLNSEEINDYAGLVYKSPGIVVCFALILFSLVGIPPLAGFVGKFAIFAAVADAYRVTGYTYLIVMLFMGGLNTLISLFYYIRVVKVMAIDPEPEHTATSSWSMVSLSGMFVALVTLPLILFFINWNSWSEWTMTAARNLF